GFDQGGYFPAAFTSAGAIAFIALAVLVVRPAQERFSTHALVAIGALAAFACWTGLSRSWSVVPDVPLLDMQRAMLYLALFGLALLAADSGRNARLLVWCVLAVIVVLVGAGLLSRLQPDLVPTTIDPLIAAFYRLDYPLGYWNAFGALASIGAVLALGLAADTRGSTVLRAAAAGAAVLLVVTMYLSLSRGAWLALILGLVVLVAIAPNRGWLLLTLVVAGGAAVVAILRLRGYPALVLDPEAGSGQAVQGSAYMRELLGLVLVAVAAQATLARIRVSALLEHQMPTIRRFALIGGGVVLVLAAVAGYAAKGGEAEGGVTAAVNDATAWLDRQWQDFLDPATSPGAGTARLVTARGARSDGYRVAIDGFEAHPLIGGGAGSFEVRYARERDIDVKIRDAHSLPLETLSELGGVGMVLLLAFLGAVATTARRALAGKGAIRPAEAAAVSAAFAVWLGHACVDWDWEMPALTGTALVLSATLFQRGRRRRSHTGRSART
ncbi:MAG: O-antigen ligase family protein, partial [Solirubrobacteraceae bacterium]